MYPYTSKHYVHMCSGTFINLHSWYINKINVKNKTANMTNQAKS